VTEDLSAHLTSVYEAWFAAIAAEGIGPLDDVLADEWIYTNYDGWVRSKPEYLDWVASMAHPVTFAGPYDVDVRRYGDLTLVLGGYRVDHVTDGSSLALRFTGLWIERDGRWQCLTHHNCAVA
jgi:ketosteroid isomerase-like protein